MNKCLYRGIDIFNPIEKNMKYYIDAFTKVYGENFRPAIEKRLKQAHYYFLGGNFDTAIKVYRLKEQEELDNLKRYKVSPSLIKLKEKDIHEKYQTIINVFLSSKQKVIEARRRYEQSQNDYLARRINLFRSKKHLPDIAENQRQYLGAIYYNILVIGEKTLTKNTNILTPKHKEQFTLLFNSLGFEEKRFEDYLKNTKLLDTIFDISTINVLNALNEQKASEEDKMNFCVTDLNRELKKLDIHGGALAYAQAGSEFIQNKSGNTAFVVNCLTMKNGFKSLCFCKNALELSLEDLVHEMGHIIDAFVIETSKNGFYYKSGYEIHHYAINPLAQWECDIPCYGEKGYRKSELFNEMLNEFVALKVCNELRKNNKQFVFGKRSEFGKIKYAYGFEIFNSFLEKHYKKLIEFKMGVDRNQPAYKYFGEKNLDKLIEIAHDYIEKRTELNQRMLKGDKKAEREKQRLFIKYSAQISLIEKSIDRRIEKIKEKQQNDENIERTFSMKKLINGKEEQTLQKEANFVKSSTQCASKQIELKNEIIK